MIDHMDLHNENGVTANKIQQFKWNLQATFLVGGTVIGFW